VTACAILPLKHGWELVQAFSTNFLWRPLDIFRVGIIFIDQFPAEERTWETWFDSVSALSDLSFKARRRAIISILAEGQKKS
jgi:hypothetical protein